MIWSINVSHLNTLMFLVYCVVTINEDICQHVLILYEANKYRLDYYMYDCAT